ncbi:MAG: hypothetical protein ABIA21_03070 [Candidatus Aenigmatarchaeota archaeon]
MLGVVRHDPKEDRFYGSRTCTSVESVECHQKKHNLPFTPEQYVAFADQFTREMTKYTSGDHKFEGTFGDDIFTVTLSGSICKPNPDDERTTDFYHIIRSIRRGGIRPAQKAA